MQSPLPGNMQDSTAVPVPDHGADSVASSGLNPLETAVTFQDAAVTSGYIDSQPEAVFGPSSYIVQPEFREPLLQDPFAGNILWQLAILALLAVYSYLIFRYMSEAGQLIRLMVARKKEGRSSDDFQGVLSPFTNAMMFVGIFSAGLAAARMIGLVSGADVYMSEGIPPLLMAAGASLFFGATGIVQYVVLKGIGALTFSGDTVAKLLWQKRIFVVALTVVATPLVLVMGLAPVRWATILCLVLLGVVSVMLIWFAFKTMRLFIGQKISILFWFLYLCIVELMPYGIVVLALLRGAAV